MQFPGARGTFGGEIRTPQSFLPKSAQLFYILCFGRSDPHRQEIVKYGVFRPFWPRTALGTWRNSRQKNANSHIETEVRETNPLQLGPHTQS